MKYPHFDPVLIDFGPLQIRWYGLMYVIAFSLAYFVMVRISKTKDLGITKQDIGDFLTYAIVGIILGARLGYCFLYNGLYYVQNPLKVLAVWEGGMSFHGGLVGIVVAGWIYIQKTGKPFWVFADLAALAAPLGLFFGRIGNFINAELYGRVTDAPWGMVFPDAGGLPRHPSQLYEALMEGLLLFFFLFWLSKKKTMEGKLLPVFLIGYGTSRFVVEFFREPDPQVGFVLGPFTMGQVLCAMMVLVGTGLIFIQKKIARPREDR
jgi:phosphatidylglycerol:prolipoprotein diacylglycerol transferase